MTALVRVVCAAVALLVLAGGALAQQDGVQLRYKMKKGEKYAYHKESVLTQVQTIKDMKVETEIKQRIDDTVMLQDVDAKGDLHVQTEATGLTASMSIKLGGKALGELTFDSKDKKKNKNTVPGADPIPLYERLSGAKLTVVLTPLGKINELKGFNELIGDLVKDNPDLAKFGGSEETAKVNLAEFFPTMQDKAVNAGDKWEVPFEVQLPQIGKAKGKRIFWYQGDGQVGQRKTAKINITTELSIDLKLEMGGAVITGTLSVSGSKGTLEFDPQAGLVAALENEITLSGNLNVAAGGMDIPVAMEQTQHFSMHLVPPAKK